MTGATPGARTGSGRSRRADHSDHPCNLAQARRLASVHHWISEQLAASPATSGHLTRGGTDGMSQTRIVLPRGFLLAGRDNVVTESRDALANPPRPITVVAPSQEALAIVCASLLGDGDGVHALRARAVIVSAPGAWDRLIDSPHSLVLIPNFEDADVASALTKGHHVVIPLGRDARHGEGHIVVPLPRSREGSRGDPQAPPGSPWMSPTATPRMRTGTCCRSAGPSRSTRGSRGRRGPRVSRAVASPR